MHMWLTIGRQLVRTSSSCFGRYRVEDTVGVTPAVGATKQGELASETPRTGNNKSKPASIPLFEFQLIKPAAR
jgi:hypothetical protein